VPATETPQLYIKFPAAAGEPPWQLKGFEKTTLASGGKAKVSLPLTARDLSIWDTTSHAWTPVSGTFGIAVGSSSRDHRLLGNITLK